MTTLPLLSEQVRGYNEGPSSGPLPGRKLAFAEYPGAGKTAVAAQGLFGDRVNTCAARWTEPANSTLNSVERERRGGAYLNGTTLPELCTEDDDCTSRSCKSDGKFCFNPADPGRGGCLTVGNSSDTACVWKDLQRCQSQRDCPSEPGVVCEAVHVQCTHCPKSAWKFSGGGGDTSGAAFSGMALYNLAADPEENHNLAPQVEGALAAPVALGSVDTLQKVQNFLGRKTADWYGCMLTGGTQPGCDGNQVTP